MGGLKTIVFLMLLCGTLPSLFADSSVLAEIDGVPLNRESLCQEAKNLLPDVSLAPDIREVKIRAAVLTELKIRETIEILNNIYNSGNEPLQILTNLSEYFKNLLIVKTCSPDLLIELTGLNEPQLKELDVQKDLLETQQIVFLIERISYYIKEVKMATNQHLWIEVAMIDLANMTENTTLFRQP